MMARLPIPGGDEGDWGQILNDYLSQAHKSDGTLKDNSVSSVMLAPNAVTAATIQDGTITEAKLDATAQAKLNGLASGGVTTVNGRTGAVVLAKTDVGLGNVDNTSDASKPVSTATATALGGKVDVNGAVAGATKTKITYDTKGLVTAGADATTADIADSSDKRYVTDAQLTILGNTSGTNSGDQSSIVGITGTKAQFDTAVTDGNILYVGDVTQYTDEMARDALGTALNAGTGISITPNDGADTISIASTLTKADLSLGNVDNTSDANKPVSSAQQIAIDAKVADAINDGTTTIAPSQNAVFDALAGKQPLDGDLTTIAGLTATTDNFIVSVSSAWASRTPAQVKTTLSLDNVDNTSNVTERAAARTLTNARITRRVFTTTSTATLTPEIDTYDLFHLTAQAAALTIANHSTSTPADGDQMRIRILDNGTARAITYGTNYVAKGGVALPSTTVISKNLQLGFEWNANLTKWNLLAVNQEV